MEPFQLVGIPRIVFGEGSVYQIPQLFVDMGNPQRRQVFVLHSKSAGDAVLQIQSELEKSDFTPCGTFVQSNEPEISDVNRALEDVRKAASLDLLLLLAVGGGSVIDVCKAVAGILTNGGSVETYMEVIGEGKPMTKRCVPWMAVPCTSGTGAEVTKNAVIGDRSRHFKASLRSPLMIAHTVVVDPLLTLKVSRSVTLSAGMDALVQCLEACTSKKANPLTTIYGMDGLQRALRSLPVAVVRGDDKRARADLALAALESGIALTNAGLGAVHGFAAPLGALYPIAHGTICAALLAPVVEANISALSERAQQHPALQVYGEIGRLMLLSANQYDPSAGELRSLCDACIRSLWDLAEQLQIPKLSEFGVKEGDVPHIVELAKKSSSMKFNPVELTDEELSLALLRGIRGR